MYHPDAFLTIAHTREAELVREAQACGLPKKVEAKVETATAWLPRHALAVALALVVLGAVLVLLIG